MQRQSLMTQQAALQIEIRQNLLNGRPPETLTREEMARINATPQGMQLAVTGDLLRSVDSQLESVQHKLYDLEK